MRRDPLPSRDSSTAAAVRSRSGVIRGASIGQTTGSHAAVDEIRNGRRHPIACRAAAWNQHREQVAARPPTSLPTVHAPDDLEPCVPSVAANPGSPTSDTSGCGSARSVSVPRSKRCFR